MQQACGCLNGKGGSRTGKEILVHRNEEAAFILNEHEGETLSEDCPPPDTVGRKLINILAA